MHRIALQIIVWKEEKYFVAQCLNNNVSSFGETKKEALKNIHEALELYYEDESHISFTPIEKPEIIESSLTYA